MSISRGSEWRQWDLHVHTASSYDYKYGGDDADELLVKAWKENNIEAVAITDHFLIDNERIKKLRKMVNGEIVIFPGVELRVDKAARNLHVILIFPETEDIDKLSIDFNAMMLDRNAKANESMETIYWDFNDVIEYAKTKRGIISLHTGRKANGLDECITNKTPFEIAIKEEISTVTGIFEMGRIRDIDDYNKHVIPVTGELPMIICSDNHNPRHYYRKEKLWIKADRTFEGLVQVLNHPEERVFVGDIPPKEDIATKRKSVYIESINIKKDDDARNVDSNWFNVEIPLNKGLTVIIGNKGGGKSAFADILGHLCGSNSMGDASFLNSERFRKGPQRYANDYSGKIAWLDGKESEYIKLSEDSHYSTTQYAQYLPQKFIERVCTDLGRDFQDEINKVIFSYVDSTVKGEAKSLDELINFKAHPYNTNINNIKKELLELNTNIITLESRLTSQYRQFIVDNLNKSKEMLDRHMITVPKEIEKPESKLSDEDKNRLHECEIKIKELEETIRNSKTELTKINNDIDTLSNSLTDIEGVINSIKHLNSKLAELKVQYFNEDVELTFKYQEPRVLIVEKIEGLKKRKEEINNLLSEFEGSTVKSLYKRLKDQEEIKKSIIDTADATEKAYQKFLEDKKQWEVTKENLLGNDTTDGTFNFYKTELDKVDKDYPVQYQKLKGDRIQKTKEILAQKQMIVEIHSDIYKPIEIKLVQILSEMKEEVNFKASVVQTDKEIGVKLLNYVNHTFAGLFNGKDKAFVRMNRFLTDTDFSSETSVIEFINNVKKVVDDNLDKSSDVIKDKESFYERLFSLDYVGVEFNLNYSGRELTELSPGERGIVLLIFYLALNKGQEPLIIDQPEDNLDNESVYKKLVPCILEAKRRRQVIVVTHNPNIAIACDAEQVIHCNIDKTKNEITYSAGSIENEVIRQKIIDVLEGTKPAFDLRRKKYTF